MKLLGYHIEKEDFKRMYDESIATIVSLQNTIVEAVDYAHTKIGGSAFINVHNGLMENMTSIVSKFRYLESKIEETEKSLARCEEEFSEKNNSLIKLQGLYGNAVREIQELKAKKEELLKAVEELRLERTLLVTQVMDLNAKIHAFKEKDADDLCERVSAMQEENARLLSEIESMRDKCQRFDNYIEKKRARNRKYRAKNSQR